MSGLDKFQGYMCVLIMSLGILCIVLARLGYTSAETMLGIIGALLVASFVNYVFLHLRIIERN